MKAAILDFNRTLFDPDSSAFIEGAIPLLQFLKSKGIKILLISLEEKGRKEQIKQISSFFDFIFLLKEKTRKKFEEILLMLNLPAREVIVIGDYLSEEIKFGNQFSMFTIRVKQGKYAGAEPSCKDEEANVTLLSLFEVIRFLKNVDLRGN